MMLSDEDLRDIERGEPYTLFDSVGGWALLLGALAFAIVKVAHHFGC